MRIPTLVLMAVLQAAPTVSDLQRAYEAGAYEQAVQAAPTLTEPRALYFAALSYDALNRAEEAGQLLSTVEARGDGDAWTWIARSTRALLGTRTVAPAAGALQTAKSAAQQAVSMLTPADPAWAIAQYQLGQSLTYERDYGQAAQRFDAAIEADPSLAYAYYYAGMSYRQTSQIDQMAARFESFLERAPQSPEHMRVEAMMRTVRGR